MSTNTKQVRTILGKKSLLLLGQGATETASQIFHFKFIREIRMNLNEYEVKVLMTYDQDYYTVLKFNAESIKTEAEITKAKADLVTFYNRLLISAADFSEEEVKNLAAQQQINPTDSKENNTKN